MAPVALGKLGKEVKSQNLTASSLTGYLSGQRSSIDKAIPAGYADCMRSKLGGAAAAATMVGSYAMMDEPEPAVRKVGDYAIPEEAAASAAPAASAASAAPAASAASQARASAAPAAAA